MPNNKRALQLAPCPSDEARIKPEPPEDLWDRLAELEGAPVPAEMPPGYFTAKEYAQKHGIAVASASARLIKMVQDGKLGRKLFKGITNNQYGYYIL